MAKGCNKKSTTKDRSVAEATTRANKLRKFRKIVRANPNDHCARNTLKQLMADAGLLGRG